MVFVRAPRPGAVKTRLAAAIGHLAAAEAYKTLVDVLLNRIAAASPIELHYAPADAADEIRHWLRPGWVALPQVPGDLGARMCAAFRRAFASGASHAALIGSDCPDIDAADLDAAWSALRDHDVVLGPAADGGYWLIAMSQPQPALFESMTWSTSAVLRETLARASRLGLRCCLLRELTDIDTEKDWLAHRQSLGAPFPSKRETSAA